MNLYLFDHAPQNDTRYTTPVASSFTDKKNNMKKTPEMKVFWF